MGSGSKLDQAFLQQVEMESQVVELFHIAQWNVDVGDLVLDFCQARKLVVQLGT